jgi:molecular chaperone DnaJ
MLGTTLTVETLEGEERIEVEPGTQPGHQYVLKGLGMPRLGSRRRGNQRVILEVFVPTNLSEEQRELASRLDETLEGDNLAPQYGEGLFSRVRRAFG